MRMRIWAIAVSGVLTLTACGGENGESADSEAEQTEAAEADIVVTGTTANAFEPSQFEVEAGTISVSMSTEGGPHTFTIELDEDADTVVEVFNVDEPATGEIELEAGTYTFYCAIPGHREAGMEGTLTVT